MINKFSKSAHDLITRLLERDPTKRIGAEGIDEIKNHKFFKGINWDKLYHKEIKPPFTPKDKLYMSETAEGGIEDTPETRKEVLNGDMNKIFEDFTYPAHSRLTFE